MGRKILGIFVCMLMITTCLVPVIANIPKKSSNELLNDTAFDRKINFFMKLAGYPSLSACIIKDDQIIWSKGYGYFDRAERKLATPDTLYVLMSISKTITGTALLQLYEQGLFELDDDVNNFLPFDLRNPNFPDDSITFRMLLSHTSSLNYDPLEIYWFNFSRDPPFDFLTEQFLRESLVPGGRYYVPSIWNTTYRPGEYAMYANVGYELIGYLVTLISGEPFVEYCDTHIFSPLDMKHTGFNLSHFDINQVAIPYQRFLLRYYTINQFYSLFGEKYTIPDQYWRMRGYPAGGLYSTVLDLSHFLIAHMNDGIYNGTRILQKETVELMHSIQTGNQEHYGFAWHYMIIEDIYATGHSGGGPGANTFMFYNQTEDIGVIYFANGAPYFLPYQGYFPRMSILHLLFTKEGTFKEEMPHEDIILSDLFSKIPLMKPQTIS